MELCRSLKRRITGGEALGASSRVGTPTQSGYLVRSCSVGAEIGLGDAGEDRDSGEERDCRSADNEGGSRSPGARGSTESGTSGAGTMPSASYLPEPIANSLTDGANNSSTTPSAESKVDEGKD